MKRVYEYYSQVFTFTLSRVGSAFWNVTEESESGFVVFGFTTEESAITFILSHEALA